MCPHGLSVGLVPTQGEKIMTEIMIYSVGFIAGAAIVLVIIVRVK